MCTSIVGIAVPAMESRSAMLVCERPPGLMMMPAYLRSASSPSLSMSAPSWFDWKKVSATPSVRASTRSLFSRSLSVARP